MCHGQFLDHKLANLATSDHWVTKKIENFGYFIFFLNIDLAKGRASSTLAPMVTPLFAVI